MRWRRLAAHTERRSRSSQVSRSLPWANGNTRSEPRDLFPEPLDLRLHDIEPSPALIRALQDTNGEVRAAAAMALVSAIPGAGGETGPTAQNVRAVLKSLIKVLEDPQRSVRAVATRALWRSSL